VPGKSIFHSMSSLLPAIGRHAAEAAKRLPRRAKTPMHDPDEEEVYERPRDGDSSFLTSHAGSRISPDAFARRSSTPTNSVKSMKLVAGFDAPVSSVFRGPPVGWATKGSIADPVPMSMSPEKPEGGDSARPQQGAEDANRPVPKLRMSLFAAMAQNKKNSAPRSLKATVNLEDKALLDALYKLPARKETLRRAAPPRFLRCVSSTVVPTMIERVQKLRAANELRAPELAPEPEKEATVHVKPCSPLIDKPKVERRKFVDPLSCDLVAARSDDQE